jgi:hypothetical protein
MASPSPPSRRVVDCAYVDALPFFLEKVEIVFSDAEIRYQTAEERKALSRMSSAVLLCSVEAIVFGTLQ